MKGSPPRFRRCKETRAADLLSAARVVFVEKGFAAARLDDVAAKAGVSKGTAYLYFESKEALFRAVIDAGLERVLEAVRGTGSLTGQADRPAVEQLRGCLDTWHGVAREAAVEASLKLLIAESGNFPDVSCRFNDTIVREARKAAVRIIEAGIASGDFRSVQSDMVADILLAAIWLSSTSTFSGQGWSRESYLMASFDILAHGLLQHR